MRMSTTTAPIAVRSCTSLRRPTRQGPSGARARACVAEGPGAPMPPEDSSSAGVSITASDILLDHLQSAGAIPDPIMHPRVPRGEPGPCPRAAGGRPRDECAGDAWGHVDQETSIY